MTECKFQFSQKRGLDPFSSAWGWVGGRGVSHLTKALCTLGGQERGKASFFCTNCIVTIGFRWEFSYFLWPLQALSVSGKTFSSWQEKGGSFYSVLVWPGLCCWSDSCKKGQVEALGSLKRRGEDHTPQILKDQLPLLQNGKWPQKERLCCPLTCSEVSHFLELPTTASSLQNTETRQR